MTAKPVIPRAAALRDMEAAADHYAEAADEETAIRFIDALQATFDAIAAAPGTGAPRYAETLDLPGLRHKRTGRLPHLVFYVERPDHIDVWRVLHARRDIPASFGSADD